MTSTVLGKRTRSAAGSTSRYPEHAFYNKQLLTMTLQIHPQAMRVLRGRLELCRSTMRMKTLSLRGRRAAQPNIPTPLTLTKIGLSKHLKSLLPQ